ncbi:hypothetical protein F4779DRAFT_570840 [Xylariaceae sp. FL0662B]|nr:hypothetical protein F4779DRAFT_570840 [Xylariaceae sp. FL0662B]
MLLRISQLLLVCTFVANIWAEYVQCETTSGSPPASDCWAAKELITNPQKVTGGVPKCFKTRSRGSGCKKALTSGKCSIVICRDDGYMDITVDHIAVQTAAQILHDTCKSGGKVGGFIKNDSAAQSNKGTKCEPKVGDTKDLPFNVEFVKA